MHFISKINYKRCPYIYDSPYINLREERMHVLQKNSIRAILLPAEMVSKLIPKQSRKLTNGGDTETTFCKNSSITIWVFGCGCVGQCRTFKRAPRRLFLPSQSTTLNVIDLSLGLWVGQSSLTCTLRHFGHPSLTLSRLSWISQNGCVFLFLPTHWSYHHSSLLRSRDSPWNRRLLDLD